MESMSFLTSDASLVLFAFSGLLATGLAIIRDLPSQRRAVSG